MQEDKNILFTGIKSGFDKQKTEGDDSINEVTGAIESLHNEYKSKVEDLIKSIDMKNND